MNREKIISFVDKWQHLYDEYMNSKYPNNANPRITVNWGKKYAKVVREGSVIGFVSLDTGDVFMAASWQKPALHARGNVNSETNGLEALNTTQYHPHVRYLK